MSDAAVNPMKAGLEDVVVSPSEICFIDGHKGRLVYRGFDVDELVAQSNFEEVTYLLWYGKLPTRKELDTHVKALSSTANRKLPPKLIAMLKLLPKKTTPMEVLRTGISALSALILTPRTIPGRATLRKTIRPRADADAGRGVGIASDESANAGRPQPAPVPRRQFPLT
jgi:citrate synthase